MQMNGRENKGLSGSRGRAVIAVTAALLVLAAAAAGFSAWYIAGTQSYSFGGNVVVEEIIGGSAEVKLSSGQQPQNIVYGAPVEATNAGGWLYSDGLSQENLSVTYSFDFVGVTAATAFAIDVSVSDINAGGAVYNSPFGSQFNNKRASYRAAVDSGYIADVDEVVIEYTQSDGVVFNFDGDTIGFNGTVAECTAELTFTFGWGDAFNGQNPYYTYRDITGEAERLAAADTLAYIEACLSGVKYTITFTPVANI